MMTEGQIEGEENLAYSVQEKIEMHLFVPRANGSAGRKNKKLPVRLVF